jgi:hypothetical protein
MKLISAGVMFFAIMGGWFLSHSGMDPSYHQLMKAAFIVISIISAALIVIGIFDLVVG